MLNSRRIQGCAIATARRISERTASNSQCGILEGSVGEAESKFEARGNIRLQAINELSDEKVLSFTHLIKMSIVNE